MPSRGDGNRPNAGSKKAQPEETPLVSVQDGKKNKKAPLHDLKQEMETDKHQIPIEELFRRLDTDPQNGLSAEEAKRRLSRDGPNALSPPPSTPEWVKFCKNLFGGFAVLLWIGAVLCFIAYGVDVAMSENALKDNVSTT
ncbi:cation transporter/ATPase [Trichuris suis]|nr:cation transporter/ATPase [Trichuris suis]